MLAGALMLAATGCAVTRVSVSSTGGEGNLPSPIAVGVTDDGRYSLFISLANNLVAGDTNGSADVFRHDSVTGVTVRADVSASGAQLPNGMADAGMSSDGRYVVFSTLDPAVAGDTNNQEDVYLRDLVAGTTTLASPPPVEGFLFSARVGDVDVSDDGRYVAFTYGNSTTSYLHRFDRQTGVTTRYVGGQFVDLQMSRDADHFALNTGCYNIGGCFPEPVLFDLPGSTAYPSPQTASCSDDRVGALSADGVWMIWYSSKRYDPLGQCPERGYYLVHRPSGGYIPTSLPRDGNVVGLSRTANAVLYTGPGDLLPGSTAAKTQLYLWDRRNLTHHREDFTIAAQMPDAGISSAVLSDEGTAVAFVTRATNMVPADHNGVDDVFVRQTGMPESP